MVTQKQKIAALKYLISRSKDENRAFEIGKRVLFFLLDSSQGLTQPVSVTLTEKENGYEPKSVDDAAHSLGAMLGSSGTTHLDEIMHLSGSGLYFSFIYGHYDENGKFSSEGIFGEKPTNAPGHENDQGGLPVRYTFWLAEKSVADSCGPGKLLPTPTFAELMAINLRITGLYPALEPTPETIKIA